MRGDSNLKETESEAVRWIRHCSVDDLNWKAALGRLTTEELLHYIKLETRITGIKKLKAEAMRRGLGVEILRREAGISAEWKLGPTADSWVRGEGYEKAFVAPGPIGGKYLLTFQGKTVGLKFESAAEAMRRGDELFSPIIDIEPEGSEMNKNQRPEVAAVDEAYNLGKRHGDQAVALLQSERLDSEAIGKIKAARFGIKTNELLMYVTFHQIKESKAYKATGRSWDEFCRDAGESSRTIDRILSELSPILKTISATQAEILGMPLSKIRFLGQAIAEKSATVAENAVFIGDQKIEIIPENKEDIEAAIDILKETRDKERETHEKEVARLKKRAESAVEEETKTLTVERDALVKELTRLKVFDPEGKDRSWSVEQMKKISQSCNEFALLCSKFIMDDRIEGDVQLMAEVEKWMGIARRVLDDLWQRWDERFNANFGN